MRVGPSTPTVPANSPSTRYGASTIAQSRSSSISFSDPMLSFATAESAAHLLEQLEQVRRALRGRERPVLRDEPARAADVQHLHRALRDQLAERGADRARKPVDRLVAARRGFRK